MSEQINKLVASFASAAILIESIAAIHEDIVTVC